MKKQQIHRTPERQLDAEFDKTDNFRKYFYVETEQAMYEGRTLKSAMVLWSAHYQSDSDVTEVLSLGSIG